MPKPIDTNLRNIALQVAREHGLDPERAEVRPAGLGQQLKGVVKAGLDTDAAAETLTVSEGDKSITVRLESRYESATQNAIAAVTTFGSVVPVVGPVMNGVIGTAAVIGHLVLARNSADAPRQPQDNVLLQLGLYNFALAGLGALDTLTFGATAAIRGGLLVKDLVDTARHQSTADGNFLQVRASVVSVDVRGAE